MDGAKLTPITRYTQAITFDNTTYQRYVSVYMGNTEECNRTLKAGPFVDQTSAQEFITSLELPWDVRITVVIHE